MPAKKVLLIGIDAGDKDSIMEWAGEGCLPTFKTLIDGSAWTVTDSPVGLFVGAGWPSFYTGASPDRHGRYCFEQLVPGSYDFARVTPRDVQVAPFWEQLDAAGKRTVVIDVPKTYASELAHGVQIVDWGAHDPDKAGLVTWPPGLAEDIVRRFGTDTVGNCNAFRTRPEEFTELRDALIDRVERKTALTEHLMQNRPWDCLVSVFSESHCVAHQCWHLNDTSHVKYRPELASAGNPMREVYIAIDKGIGRLIEAAGEDVVVAVLASHGVSPHYDGNFMLDDMLLAVEGNKALTEPSRAAPAVSLAWQLVPKVIRKRFKAARKRARVRLNLDDTGPTPARRGRRRYFRVPNNDVYGGIRLNVIGREPSGKIRPGREYDEVCAALRDDLMAFVNLDTGEPAVLDVLRADRFYDGPLAHYLPDLFVAWNRSAPMSRLTSPKTGLVTGEYRKCRTGDHQSEGLLFFTGAGQRPARRADTASIMDIAPTIAELLGVALDDPDGRSLVTDLRLGGAALREQA